jgi:predicted permease
VILTLALGIGANVAIFSVADAVLFRPLPYGDPDRVLNLQLLDRRTGARYTQTPFEFLRVLDERHEGLGPVGIAEPETPAIVQTPDGADAVGRVAVTQNYFHILEVVPYRGRIFDERDASHPGRSAMLTYESWSRRFGADEDVVGSAISLGDSTFDVVGVLPRWFVFPSALVNLREKEIITVQPFGPVEAEGGAVFPIVRLQPGVTVERAQAEIDTLVAPIARGRGEPEQTLVLEDVRSLLYPLGQPTLRLLLTAAGLVLLMTCVNLANVLLARERRRERDVGIRSALGADRSRLIRPLIFEALLIGIAGAALAAMLTSMTFDALIRQVPRAAYATAPVGVDGRVLLFTLFLGLLSGFACSALPAWRASRMDALALVQGRRESRDKSDLLGRPLIAIQTTLALLLMFGAAAIGTELVRVLSVPLGFEPQNVLTLRFSAPGETALERRAFYLRVAEGLAARPDVARVGAAGTLPLSGGAGDEPVRSENGRTAGLVHVLPGYFEAVGLRLLRGRLLEDADLRSGAEVAVISEAAARMLFGDREPLGETLETYSGRRLTVIGLVADIGVLNSGGRTEPFCYAIPREETRQLTLVAQMRASDAAVPAEMRRLVNSLAPTALVSARWWRDTIDGLTEFRGPRFQTIVLGSFGTLALTLSALGVFSVVAAQVGVRKREMGIRLAVGATPHSLVRWTLRHALRPVTAGLLVGIAVAQPLRARFETDSLWALAIAVGVITVAAILASYLPARRASRIDPIEALRQD